MAWIKISESDGGTFAQEATPDPKKIVTINELQAQIDEIEAIEETPSNEELIELGKSLHPYFDAQDRIQIIQDKIDRLI